MINKFILDQIQAYSIETDWLQTFGGMSRGSRHLFRVNKIATFLTNHTDADISIVQAGAWLHDIGLTKGNDDKPEIIRTLALDYLKTLNLPLSDANAIADCVASHEGIEKAKSIEAQVVHDADVLDKQGMLGIIRHTWKLTNLIMPNASGQEVTNEVVKHIAWRESKLYLKKARVIASLLNKDLPDLTGDIPEFEKLIAEIMKLAKKGVVSDEIAKMIEKKLPKELKELLKLQLECGYLPK